MSLPVATGSGESLSSIDRSADGGTSTVVVALDSLFARLGSPVADDTVAGFVTLGAAERSGVTTIVTVASLAAPAATVPRPQVPVLVPAQEPWLAVAGTRVGPAGSGSETLTALAESGP